MVGKGIPQRKIEKQEPGKTVLEIEDAYCENDGVTVLKGLSLHVKEGEIVGAGRRIRQWTDRADPVSYRAY